MEVPDSEDPVPARGTLPGVQCGETLELFGYWSHDRRYGRQFDISYFNPQLPATVHGIRMYLSSGFGITKAIANRIVDHFGTDTIRIISEEPGRLQEVSRIGKRLAERITSAWNEKSGLEFFAGFFIRFFVSMLTDLLSSSSLTTSSSANGSLPSCT